MSHDFTGFPDDGPQRYTPTLAPSTHRRSTASTRRSSSTSRPTTSSRPNPALVHLALGGAAVARSRAPPGLGGDLCRASSTPTSASSRPASEADVFLSTAWSPAGPSVGDGRPSGTAARRPILPPQQRLHEGPHPALPRCPGHGQEVRLRQAPSPPGQWAYAEWGGAQAALVARPRSPTRSRSTAPRSSRSS